MCVYAYVYVCVLYIYIYMHIMNTTDVIIRMGKMSKR
jgi:hypothetical protein